VEEKTGEDKNAKFDQDFKTLADVLIQETVRHDVGAAFPQLASRIMGEESNMFTNQLGESITVEIQDTEEATKALLMKVLDNNDVAARLLSTQVYARL
jgi:inositol polyphosphate 1-phosphatase